MHRVVHFEIYADDPGRARGILPDDVRLAVRPVRPMDYWLDLHRLARPAGINGGLHKRLSPLERAGIGAFVCTVDVDDIER